MKIALYIAVIGLFVVLAQWQFMQHELDMYSEFQKHMLAAQVLEVQLQRTYNDTNITLQVYNPTTEVGL